VTTEEEEGTREAGGWASRANVDLLAIRALIAAVTPRGLLIAQRLAFKISARHLVEQELELDAEPALVTLVEMRTERVLVRVEHVEAAIEPRVIDARKWDAEQVFEGAVGIPALGHFELALLAAKTRQREHAGGQFPRHLLLPRLDDLAQKRVQSQPSPERKREIDLPEIAHPLHAHARQIHLRPLRPRRRLERLSQPPLHRCRCAAFEQLGHLLPAAVRGTLQSRLLAQRGHDLLARPARRAHRFDQGPVIVSLALDGAAIAAQKHGAILRAAWRADNGQLSTTQLPRGSSRASYSVNSRASTRSPPKNSLFRWVG